MEPLDLKPLAAEVMPRRGLARKADGTPTQKTQRNHRFAEGFAYTDPDSHLMKSDGHYIQGYIGQLVVDRDHQVIVAVGVSNQAPDVEHLVSHAAAHRGHSWRSARCDDRGCGRLERIQH